MPISPVPPGRRVIGRRARQAIFPLHRDGQGRLGLKVQGSGGAGEGNVSIQNNTNVTVEGGSGMGEAEAARIGTMISKQIDRKIAQNMLEQSRPGGVLHRRYGSR